MLTSVLSLWLPVLLSGIALFFASFVAWMVLPHHKKEWIGMPNEEAVMRQFKNDNLAPGQYCFPYAATPQEMNSAAHKAKLQAGPRGTLTLWASPANMGVNLLLTFLFFLVVSAVIAYLAAMVMSPGEDRLRVFRFVGTVGILTYASSNIMNGIWFRRKVAGEVIDGVAYGIITAAIFAGLWPGVSV